MSWNKNMNYGILCIDLFCLFNYPGRFLGMQYGDLGNSEFSPQWKHSHTKWVRRLASKWAKEAAMKEWRLDRWLEKWIFYLVLLGDVLLMVLLHLPKLGLQTTKLNFHLLYILQVPLGALVQHLDGLGHVLDLYKWARVVEEKISVCIVIRIGDAEKRQQTLQYVAFGLAFVSQWFTNSDIRPTSQGPQTHGASVGCILFRHLFSPDLMWSRNMAHLLFIRRYLLLSVAVTVVLAAYSIWMSNLTCRFLWMCFCKMGEAPSVWALSWVHH